MLRAVNFPGLNSSKIASQFQVQYRLCIFLLKFPGLSKTASKLLGLVPTVQRERHINCDELVETYRGDLPAPALVSEEMERWRDMFDNVPLESIPESPAAAIKVCDAILFPNIFTLLKLACTLNVTSCECERSASVVRRLHHYTRATMGMERLSSLALIHIHYGFNHNLDNIISRFSQLHPRNMELENILYSQNMCFMVKDQIVYIATSESYAFWQSALLILYQSCIFLHS